MARTCAAVIVLSTLLAAAAALAASPSAELTCPRITATPRLDGRLDEWPALPMATLGSKEDWRPTAQQFADYGGPKDIAAGIWTAWDANACYLVLQVQDNVLVRVRSVAEIDHGDSIVLSFVPADGGETNEFVVAPLKSGYPVYRAKPAGRTGEVRVVTVGIGTAQEEGGGRRLIYEVSIPWSELAPLQGQPGDRFTLVVSVCDDDGAGLKGCLERRLPIVLWEGGFPVRPAAPAPAAPALAPVFPAPGAARYDGQCFVLQGQEVMLYGGEIAYAELPATSWQGLISDLKAAGMNLVGVTVPWSHHQPRPGAADLTALDQFLSLCGREGVWAQVNVGPYAGERWAGGGVPGWVLALESADSRWAATEAWLGELMAVVHAHEISKGGPVATVAVRPLPQGDSGAGAAMLTRLTRLVRQSGVEAPLLTSNLPASRDNTKQNMANVLDTITFYSPATGEEVLAALGALAKEENGPPVVAGMAGEYGDGNAASRSADRVKLALAAGAKLVLVGDFAPGLETWSSPAAGPQMGAGVVQASGARTAGCDELRLIGAFLRQFGPSLVHAAQAAEAAQCDDPAVEVIARVTKGTGFLFLADKEGTAAHHLRLSFTDPNTGEEMTIPEAGTVTLPAGAVKVLPLNLRVGRGTLRYTTSEMLGVATVGERTALVVYGDPETAGEISLGWPGPPLVSGEVARQSWNPETKALVLDYFHGQEDQCVLVDELEIVILSRERARHAAVIAGAAGDTVVISGTYLAGAALWPDKLEAALDCRQGEVQVSALTPRRPSAVLVDGKPADFTFSTPDRVARFPVTTGPFEEERKATSVWQEIGRAVQGGPPLLQAEFDRGWFMGEPAAEGGKWRPLEAMARGPDDLGLLPGQFVRLRARFDPAGRTRISVNPFGQVALVFLNGRLVPELSGRPEESEALPGEALGLGENELMVIVRTRPRAEGREGVAEKPARFPAVSLIGVDGAVPVTTWEVSVGLAGEALGWTQQECDVSTWHLIRLGPWRQQGRDLAKVSGIGWYRVPFGLPEKRQWRIPYQVTVAVTGAAALYLNGHSLGVCPGDGTYAFPAPGEWLSADRENVLAAAVYGPTDATGLQRVEVAADRAHMSKRRAVEVKF